ncbi:MAG TPA: NAD-dependent epimerase/dehydratase family protein [Candidatus Didemnitutus sp.]|nr:NAD-dependent epimerase/dehydratase family protein [Candidatus Didemnitutus sp.]
MNADPVFVTGASGFIGGKLARRLLENGRAVRVLSRRPLPDLAALGAEVIAGDLDTLPALHRGCMGAGTIFHVAGRVGVWGPASEFFRVNVTGTQNLLAAARSAEVRRFVYTSSPSVVYSGRDLAGIDESAPLCTSAPTAYPTSKAAAEKIVLGASAPEFLTVALRPHVVWGPGDANLVPRVLARARRGRLKIIGEGRNRVDCTHIENVVDAHLLAERALELSPQPSTLNSQPALPPAAGKAYFITNGEPVVLWDWINELLRAVGIPEVTKRVSLDAAARAGFMLETIWRCLRLRGEPPMTRFVAHELATDHWFDISAARRDLGYAPRVTMAKGTRALIEQLRM